jgi:hypothetical protein
MATDWQRVRAPEDVPTPVAVAVSDFCRRARAPAAAHEVREALSTLSEADDFRVRELTDGEPESSPLGPYAVVDVLRGTPQELASRRQAVGYYEVVREVVSLRAQPPAPAAEPLAAAAPRAAPAPAPTAGEQAARPSPAAPARPQPVSVSERIAPKKRVAAGLAEPEGEEDGGEDGAFRRRDLPRPRGRFSNVAPPLTPLANLARPEARDTVQELIGQHPHRYSLTLALAAQYTPPKGGDLRWEDVMVVLDGHGLRDALEGRERAHLLDAYTGQRGASGRVAWALGLSPAELQQLVRTLGLTEQVEAVRERFRGEALSPRTVAARLDMLGRDKYLKDLGILRRFQETLSQELREAIQAVRGEASEPHALVGRIARRLDAEPELVQRAIERLKLESELRRAAAASPVPPGP